MAISARGALLSLAELAYVIVHRLRWVIVCLGSIISVCLAIVVRRETVSNMTVYVPFCVRRRSLRIETLPERHISRAYPLAPHMCFASMGVFIAFKVVVIFWVC